MDYCVPTPSVSRSSADSSLDVMENSCQLQKNDQQFSVDEVSEFNLWNLDFWD